MPDAAKTLIVAFAAAASLSACGKADQQDQNIVVDNGTMANADIEALPPDESSATPSDELANGTAEPAVNDLNVSGNSY